ncbi:hypothetical protein AL755_16450 [Arthrobacter sp. ERGS1:01]|uniref:DUF4129 domain-containing protein n=1 Tax=Arthrobacter sp. ERGS1:01 TaxID=1704044 RepID=UPI0006B4CC6E|nr:DUF4129 domain-containing protein [Arthrobacter sp. ERGS1:01]ALE06679.1 hypothetical protein AL755_16450 [Arthrobacter sp. ERGS1:01]
MLALAALPGALGFDVPVTPGADEARRWAAEELAKAVYQNAKPGLAEQFIAWVKKALAGFLDGMGSLNANAGLLVVIGILLVAVIAAVAVVRPRLNRKRARDAAVFAGPSVLTAGQHRSLARAAAAAGDLDTAVSEQFRALVRAGEERDVVSPAPGRTAAEVAAELQRAFPAHGQALLRAADIFNAVRYGHAKASQSLLAELVATDRAISAAKPVYADELVAP